MKKKKPLAPRRRTKKISEMLRPEPTGAWTFVDINGGSLLVNPDGMAIAKTDSTLVAMTLADMMNLDQLGGSSMKEQLEMALERAQQNQLAVAQIWEVLRPFELEGDGNALTAAKRLVEMFNNLTSSNNHLRQLAAKARVQDLKDLVHSKPDPDHSELRYAFVRVWEAGWEAALAVAALQMPPGRVEADLPAPETPRL